MSKLILIFCLILLSSKLSFSRLIWGKYDNVNTTKCPNPDNLADKNYKLELTNLPVSFVNGPKQHNLTYEQGPYSKYCNKPGCTSYEYSTYVLKTPYVQALTGFRVELEWHYSRANYSINGTKAKLNNNWMIYYNQNDCYFGGAEFGFMYYNRGQVTFYAGCGFANMKNITDNVKDRIRAGYEILPSNGINYLNLTAIANNTGYIISISFTSDNFKTLVLYDDYIPYLDCLDPNFNRGVGKVNGNMDPGFNIYGQDKIIYKSIDYVYDTDRLTNTIDNVIG